MQFRYGRSPLTVTITADFRGGVRLHRLSGVSVLQLRRVKDIIGQTQLVY